MKWLISALVAWAFILYFVIWPPHVRCAPYADTVYCWMTWDP